MVSHVAGPGKWRALVRSAVGDRRRTGGQLAVGQRGPAAGRGLARPDGAHGGMETAGRGPAAGAAAEYRRRWAGRPGRARRGAPRRGRLSDRLLPILAEAAEAR